MRCARARRARRRCSRLTLVRLRRQRMRVPSWCDRVLWKSMDGAQIRQLMYRDVPSIRTSDHTPVVASFELHPYQLPMMPRQQLSHSFALLRRSTLPESARKARFQPVTLRLYDMRATNLPPKKEGVGTVDPYLVLAGDFLEEPVVTKHVPAVRARARPASGLSPADACAWQTLNPVWPDSAIPPLQPFVIDPEFLRQSHILVQVMDRDVLKQDVVVGEASISLDRVVTPGFPEYEFEVDVLRFGRQAGRLFGRVRALVSPALLGPGGGAASAASAVGAAAVASLAAAAAVVAPIGAVGTGPTVTIAASPVVVPALGSPVNEEPATP